jgi:hypothetical protein
MGSWVEAEIGTVPLTPSDMQRGQERRAGEERKVTIRKRERKRKTTCEF